MRTQTGIMGERASGRLEFRPRTSLPETVFIGRLLHGGSKIAWRAPHYGA